jgi:hypothetical protein
MPYQAMMNPRVPFIEVWATPDGAWRASIWHRLKVIHTDVASIGGTPHRNGAVARRGAERWLTAKGLKWQP